jgi:hypothetical protein
VYTDWARPDAPLIKIKENSHVFDKLLNLLPQVQFKFFRSKKTLEQNSRLIADDETDLYFNIQVKRQVNQNFLPGSSIAWIDVDHPVLIKASDLENVGCLINDSTIEREYPDKPAKFIYNVFVQEFFIVSDGSGITEELIRKQEKFDPLSPIEIPEPQSGFLGCIANEI